MGAFLGARASCPQLADGAGGNRGLSPFVGDTCRNLRDDTALSKMICRLWLDKGTDYLCVRGAGGTPAPPEGRREGCPRMLRKGAAAGRMPALPGLRPQDGPHAPQGAARRLRSGNGRHNACFKDAMHRRESRAGRPRPQRGGRNDCGPPVRRRRGRRRHIDRRHPPAVAPNCGNQNACGLAAAGGTPALPGLRLQDGLHCRTTQPPRTTKKRPATRGRRTFLGSVRPPLTCGACDGEPWPQPQRPEERRSRVRERRQPA